MTAPPGRRFRYSRTSAVFNVAAAALSVVLTCAAVTTTHAYPLPESIMEKQEAARSLEREISRLESELARVNADWASIAAALEDMQRQIAESSSHIERAQAELGAARQRLNQKIREMYVEGGTGNLAVLLASSDFTEFMVNLERLARLTGEDARRFAGLKEERRALQERHSELLQRRQAAAVLARSIDSAPIEAMLSEKRRELAILNGELVSIALPPAASPSRTTYDPVRVYSTPEENGFVRTGQTMSGYSSWYGNEFHGRPTASGEMFDQYAFTCAHRTLPFGTWLRVTFRARSVIVRVNDRGPFIKGRFLDLSRGAAESIGLTGVQWVDCEIVVPGGR